MVAAISLYVLNGRPASARRAPSPIVSCNIHIYYMYYIMGIYRGQLPALQALQVLPVTSVTGLGASLEGRYLHYWPVGTREEGRAMLLEATGPCQCVYMYIYIHTCII